MQNPQELAAKIHEHFKDNPAYMSVGIGADKIVLYMKKTKKVDFSFVKTINYPVEVVKTGQIVPLAMKEVEREETAASEFRCNKCNSDANSKLIQETISYIRTKRQKSSTDPVVGQCSCGHVMTVNEFEDLSDIPVGPAAWITKV